MGLTDFVAGWALGAKIGNQGFDEVVGTARGILDSKEFQDFVRALRSHAAYSLHDLADLVGSTETLAPGEDLIEFVRTLAARREAMFGHPPGGDPRGPSGEPPPPGT